MKSARFAWLGQMRPWLTLLPWFVSCLEKLGILARALKAGNANRIIAFNPGVQDRVRPYSRHEDYTCGEQNRFLDQPVSRWTGGEQWHILSYLGHDRLGNYLGAGWGQPGVRYSKADLTEYIAEVNRAGGVVSIDVFLDGKPYVCELTRSVQAQFVRVSALKPDGPDQKGAQMAVAELEAYE